MSLSDLASLGSFVSGLAVLASLVFLFFQMRQMNEQVQQTERNQRALMNQGIIDRAEENVRWLAEPHMANLTSRVQAGDTEFIPLELEQLVVRLRIAVLSTQDTYIQHREGLADQMMLGPLPSSAEKHSQPTRLPRDLEERRSTYAPEWRAYIDQFIEETPITSASNLVGLFKEALAEIVR